MKAERVDRVELQFQRRMALVQLLQDRINVAQHQPGLRFQRIRLARQSIRNRRYLFR